MGSSYVHLSSTRNNYTNTCICIYERINDLPAAHMPAHRHIVVIVKCGKDSEAYHSRLCVCVCVTIISIFHGIFAHDKAKTKIDRLWNAECWRTVMCESGMELEFWHIHRLPTLKIRRQRERESKKKIRTHRLWLSHIIHCISQVISSLPTSLWRAAHTPTEYKKNRFLPPKKLHVTLRAFVLFTRQSRNSKPSHRKTSSTVS